MRCILAVIAAITSSAALAAGGPATAGLAAPARVAMVVTDAGVWHCDGASCAGPANVGLRQSVLVCTAIAAAAGRVTAFTAIGYRFSDADLARCNRHVQP